LSIQLRSYAKINWTLDVLFRREDGFHELRTIYQSVSLYDTLYLTKTSGEIVVTCEDSRVPCDETNLAHRAAVQLREAAGIEGGVRIQITKRIPVAGGLGGGSSNAAAVLLGLARLWNTGLDQSRMIEIAMALGSDVPFFLVGGTALGIGRGEEVYPFEQVACDNLVLANPGFAVSTAAAYSKLSRLTRQEAVRIIPLTLLAAKGIRELPLAAGNDLEEVVEAAYPEIAEVKRRLLSLGARGALMSGSGATVFGVFDNSQTAEQARDQVRAAGWWAEAVRTINRREYAESIFETAI
jgi:4-diphosphocytidyl-2-C-methyl-D-erythritol kinase